MDDCKDQGTASKLCGCTRQMGEDGVSELKTQCHVCLTLERLQSQLDILCHEVNDYASALKYIGNTVDDLDRKFYRLTARP